MCSVLVVAYLVSGAVADVRAQRVRGWAAAGGVALFLVMLPLASLAVLLPRIDALQASSLAAGYDRLGDALGSLGGADSASIQDNGVWAAWPLALGAAPGAYAGAVILLAVPLAVRARRHRALVWGVGGALVLTWVAMLDAVVTAGWFRSLLLRIPFGDVYLHNPGRMRYLAVIAIPDPRRGRDPGPAGRSDAGAACRVVARRRRRAVARRAAGGRCHPHAVRAARGGARRGRRRRLAPGHRADAMGVGRRGRRPLGRTRRQRRVVTLGHHRRHDPPRPGGRRASQPDPAAAPGPRGGRRSVRGADGVRPPVAGERRAIPHVGPAGGGVRQGLPVHAAPSRLAGPGDGTRHVVLDPRPPRLQPRAAPPLLGLPPCAHGPAGLLQRRGDRSPDQPGRRIAGRALPRDPHRDRVAAARDGRRTRAGLRPRGALDVAAPRLGGDVLDRGGLDRRGPAGRHRPRLRSCRRSRPRIRPRAAAGARCRTGNGERARNAHRRH